MPERILTVSLILIDWMSHALLRKLPTMVVVTMAVHFVQFADRSN